MDFQLVTSHKPKGHQPRRIGQSLESRDSIAVAVNPLARPSAS